LGGGERERLEEKNDCWEREDGHGDEVMELAAATSECQVGDGVGMGEETERDRATGRPS
jgi:hypothetical protein